MQEEKKDLPAHADYLRQLATPEYKTKPKSKRKQEKDLGDDLYNYTCRIIHLPSIPDEKARNYYEKYFGEKKVLINGVAHALIDNDGIYTYMYNNFPLKWVTADDKLDYLLFEYRDET